MKNVVDEEHQQQERLDSLGVEFVNVVRLPTN